MGPQKDPNFGFLTFEYTLENETLDQIFEKYCPVSTFSHIILLYKKYVLTNKFNSTAPSRFDGDFQDSKYLFIGRAMESKSLILFPRSTLESQTNFW